MKVAHLETFAEVAATGSFTQAARNLFTTQPTVTTHIQLLEQELGYQLFKRSKKRVQLTEKGKAIYDKVDEIFKLIDNIKNSNDNSSLGLTGTLNIAASSIMGANYLPAILKKVFFDYPGVNIQLKFGNSHAITSWVDDGFVEMGFAPFSSGFPRISFTPLLIQNCILVSGSQSYKYYQERIDAGKCVNSDFIIREKGTKLYEVSMQWLKKQPFFSENSMPHILWNFESIKNLIIEGAGIAILPRFAVDRCLRFDLVREIETDINVEDITYYMIERQDSKYNKLMKMFKQHVLDYKIKENI